MTPTNRRFSACLIATALAALLPVSGGAQLSPGTPSLTPVVQTFSISGTWTKPTGTTWVKVWAFPGGSGASNGFACPNLSICPGPSGPGGGSVGFWEGPASALPGTVTVTVGGAGASGASPTTGGQTSFGTFAVGNSGGVGAAGNSTPTSVNGGFGNGGMVDFQASATGGSTVAVTLWSGSSGANSLATGVSNNSTSAQFGGVGAGAGGGIATGGVAQVGGYSRGSLALGLTNTTTPICTSASAGASATGMYMGGSGPGGGACTSAAGGNGGNGGFPGGAAGPGGDGYNGTTPGTAGTAAAGEVVVEIS